jgi:anti-sigma regulatory factor (Ser/Thr protein kinase)
VTDRQLWRLDSPDPIHLSRISDAVEALLEASGLSERGRFTARLITEELVLNAFHHGGARAVTLELAGRDRLVLEDDGVPFDPSTVALEPATGERGRGLLLVRGFAKQLQYARRGERNRTEVVLPDA